MGMYTKTWGTIRLNDSDIAKAIKLFYSLPEYDTESQDLWEFVRQNINDETDISIMNYFSKCQRHTMIPGGQFEDFSTQLIGDLWHIGSEIKAYCDSLVEFLDQVLMHISDDFFIECHYEECDMPSIYIKIAGDFYYFDCVYDSDNYPGYGNQTDPTIYNTGIHKDHLIDEFYKNLLSAKSTASMSNS